MIGREIDAPAGFWHSAGRPLPVARAVVIGRVAKGNGYRVALFGRDGVRLAFARIKHDTARRYLAA
jgi:hypothetical protein